MISPLTLISFSIRTYLSVLSGDVEDAMQSPEVYESEEEEEVLEKIEEEEDGNADREDSHMTSTNRT